MKQYLEMKKKHPDAVLLFRVGDFYETFSDDAVTASEILGITLTRRANGSAAYVELAGFPHHALDTYLPRLVRAGKRVAICEQLEDPKLTKKLVKRGITELVTPGVVTGDASLDAKENNFLGGVWFAGDHRGSAGKVGVALLDISTGEFLCAEGSPEYADKLIASFAPKEMLRPNGSRQQFEETFSWRGPAFDLDDWIYTDDAATMRLLKHFGTTSLKGFGLGDSPAAVIAAASLLHYMDITNHTDLSHITSLRMVDESAAMRLDRFTIRNLELLHSNAGERGLSLLKALDRTLTPMGARMLQTWVAFPLLDVKDINARHDAVEYFFRRPDVREKLTVALRRIGDYTRLIGKVASRRATPRDLLSLAESIRGAADAQTLLAASGSTALADIVSRMTDTTPLAATITRTINSDAPAQISKGGVFASGISTELDELRDLAYHSKEALDAICARETERTGISSLKIGFNNVFGFYLEVRNTHKEKVPEEWIRKQTLANAERYITPELKELEQKILTARDSIESLEAELYGKLLDHLAGHCAAMQVGATAMATADCLLSFAEVADEFKYVRPVVDDSLRLSITNGRHPVIERTLPPGEPYIANSVAIDPETSQILMITGPNMSGKSALLRQTALIVLMAQMGSFVPAEAAAVGLVDKVFTRVGATDNISSGESTFMVEMNEAASILNNMTPRSLILFDELGRGTSTYDGISIAWSIVEHIHENGRCRPKTLFATHYHELNEMEKTFKRIVNFNVSVKEIEGKVVFMRKLARGGSEHSFGIHVAKLAGMPPSIIKRANQVLEHLESAAVATKEGEKMKAGDVTKAALGGMGESREGFQLSFFQLDDPLLSQIRDAILDLDIDSLTPLQALNKLHDLQGLVTGKP
ncbi:MAG: DNA mismatch repair protein MutS [Bacteroides sp.]|nr:DNA mismatch repair protein MutS [Bacteroides sp.]